MKLDKIAFAKLIGYLGRQFAISLDSLDMQTIDDLIDVQAPTPEPLVVPKASCIDVDTLLSRMGKDGYKIEAIKAYRALTGAGLKESKDAVERYWPSSEYRTAKQIKVDMVDSIDRQLDNPEAEHFVLQGFG